MKVYDFLIEMLPGTCNTGKAIAMPDNNSNTSMT
jgi:hypothetical protein